MTTPEIEVGCRDECGRKTPMSRLEGSGWELLPIQNRWRCVECWRELKKANESRQEEAK